MVEREKEIGGLIFFLVGEQERGKTKVGDGLVVLPQGLNTRPPGQYPCKR